MLGLVALVFGLVAMRGESLPTLTAETLNEASQRWERDGPRDYDLEVEIRGRQPGHVKIEVRDREVTHMERDGVVPDQRRTWQYWSVPSQFDTIEQDMSLAQPSGFAGVAGLRSRLQARFDPQFGYPRHYRRIVLGSDLSLEWEVVRFVPRDGSARPESR